MASARVLITVLVAGTALAIGAPAASAAVSTACPGKPAGLTTGVTLSVSEASGAVVTPDGSGYMACVFPDREAYSIVIGLVGDGDALVEEMGPDNRDRVFTLGFTLPDGQSAASAELYARVTSYTIGTNGRDVSLVLQPVTYTKGTNDPDPAPLQDKTASIIGGIRYNSAGQTRGISGMWIGASANSYTVTLSGSCPNWSTGAASGSKEPGAVAVQLSGPHLTFAGALNRGSLQAFIPAATVTACFGVTTVAEVVSALSVTRTDGSVDSSLAAGTGFIASEVAGGLLVTVPEITFSRPTYTIRSTALAASSASKAPGKVASAGTKGVGRTSATVRWKAATANGSAITAYQTRVSRGKTWTSWTTVKGKAKGGWFSQTVKGLSPGKPYTVEIRATSAAGNGPVTQVRFTTKR